MTAKKLWAVVFDAMQLDERDGRQLRFGVGKSKNWKMGGSQVHFCQLTKLEITPFSVTSPISITTHQRQIFPVNMLSYFMHIRYKWVQSIPLLTQHAFVGLTRYFGNACVAQEMTALHIHLLVSPLYPRPFPVSHLPAIPLSFYWWV